MWGSLLVVALGAALNPVRLGLALLVISRPRPLQNLVAYWAGCLIGAIQAVLIPLTLLRVTPMFDFLADGLATNSVVAQIRIGVGVLVLSIAAVMIIQSLMRRRQKAHMPISGGDPSNQALDKSTHPAISRLLSRLQDTPAEGGSAFRRLLRRVRDAWENGALWVAFVIGFYLGGPEPDVLIFLFAIVLTSGATIGTQVAAVIVYALVMLAVVEIIIVSYLVTPARTQAMVQRLHDWALAHRRKILVAMCAVGGVVLVTTGVASI
jgi:hypothetical protein